MHERWCMRREGVTHCRQSSQVLKGTVLVRPQLLNETSFPDAGRCVVLRARRQGRGQKASLCWCGTQAQGGREG